MKRILVLSMVLLSILSCGKEKMGDGGENYRHDDKLYCEFMSIDAYETEIELTDISNQAGTFGYIMRLELKDSGDRFLKKHRVSDEVNAQKEIDLANTLTSYHFRYDTGIDTYLKVMYGGVSGSLRVYADDVVDGRPVGEDIADLFVVQTRGKVSFPDMNLIIDEHQNSNSNKGQADYYEMSFREYFTEGIIPFGVDYDTYLCAKEGYSYLWDDSITIHIEIPVTGIDAEGQEKSVVLTGTIQH